MIGTSNMYAFVASLPNAGKSWLQFPGKVPGGQLSRLRLSVFPALMTRPAIWASQAGEKEQMPFKSYGAITRRESATWSAEVKIVDPS
jgi:hypothetical protein